MNALDSEGLQTVAALMAVSARTAPKAGGSDWIQVTIATAREKSDIVQKMRDLAEEKGARTSRVDKKRGEAVRMDWMSDAGSVDQAGLLVLIGVQGRRTVGLNCGGCGFQTCAQLLKQKPVSIEVSDFPGPFCMFRIMDLSIAAGSAVKTAMDHNVDNRMMQKVGVAALKLGTLAPCDLILGFPLSATGKNIFFDRPEKLEAWKLHFSAQDK